MYKSVIHPFLYLYLDVHFCYGTDNQDLSCFARKAHIIIDEIVVARTSLVVEHLFSDLCLHQAFLPVVNSTHPTFSHSYHHILSTRGLVLHSFWQGAASFHLRPAGTALIWDWYKIGSWRFSKTSHQMTMFRATLAFRDQDDMIFIASDSCSYSMFRIQNPEFFTRHLSSTMARFRCELVSCHPLQRASSRIHPSAIICQWRSAAEFFRVFAQVAASPCHVLCCYLYSLGILMQISLLLDIWYYILYIHVIKWHKWLIPNHQWGHNSLSASCPTQGDSASAAPLVWTAEIAPSFGAFSITLKKLVLYHLVPLSQALVIDSHLQINYINWYVTSIYLTHPILKQSPRA